jgi:hypothetical protein
LCVLDTTNKRWPSIPLHVVACKSLT